MHYFNNLFIEDEIFIENITSYYSPANICFFIYKKNNIIYFYSKNIRTQEPKKKLLFQTFIKMLNAFYKNKKEMFGIRAFFWVLGFYIFRIKIYYTIIFNIKYIFLH
jgi:hypothetical protein